MKKILVVALSLALFSTACSTAWVSTLDSILSAAAPALIDILQIGRNKSSKKVFTRKNTPLFITR